MYTCPHYLCDTIRKSFYQQWRFGTKHNQAGRVLALLCCFSFLEAKKVNLGTFPACGHCDSAWPGGGWGLGCHGHITTEMSWNESLYVTSGCL